MEYYLDAFRKYADFKSRATRIDYWMFFLFNYFFTMSLMTLLITLVYIHDFPTFDIPDFPTYGKVGFGLLVVLYSLALIIPSLALTVRRLHDSGRSGAYIFVAFIPFIGSIYLLVLLLLKGEKKENKYGEQAKEVSFGTPSAKALIGLAVFWIIVAIGSIFGWSQIKGNFSLTPHIFIVLLIPITVLIIGAFFNKSADTRNPGIALAISSAIILIYSLANLLRSSIMEDISRSPWLFSLPMLTLLSEFALIWLAVLWINKKKSYHAPIVALAIIETTICFLHASMPLYTSMIQSEINRLFFIATIIETLIVSFMYFLLAVFLLPAKKKEAPSSAAAS